MKNLNTKEVGLLLFGFLAGFLWGIFHGNLYFSVGTGLGVVIFSFVSGAVIYVVFLLLRLLKAQITLYKVLGLSDVRQLLRFYCYGMIHIIMQMILATINGFS